jgi:hypothetical protein
MDFSSYLRVKKISLRTTSEYFQTHFTVDFQCQNLSNLLSILGDDTRTHRQKRPNLYVFAFTVAQIEQTIKTSTLIQHSATWNKAF